MLKKVLKTLFMVVFCFALALNFCGCKNNNSVEVELPNEISKVTEDNEPILKVYDTSSKSIKEMSLEKYLLGVVAGEMYNSWELEALKAQAVLARTYTLYFLQNFSSKYEGADISNDVTEAQAYNESMINDNIKKAVEETKGKVLTVDGEIIETWFHSNSGGVTTTSNNGLNNKADEKYTKVQKSVETAENSQNYEWRATFSKDKVLNAIREMGASISSISSFSIGEVDASGRAKTFKIGGSEIDANTFRLKLGSTEMKSTKITNLVVSSTSIYMEGKGYGHGVGMSQWGAKILAQEGKDYQEILNFYFDNIEISNYSIK